MGGVGRRMRGVGKRRKGKGMEGEEREGIECRWGADREGVWI